MLPIPVDESFEIDSSGWTFEPEEGEYNEADTDYKIFESSPESFDYSGTE